MKLHIALMVMGAVISSMAEEKREKDKEMGIVIGIDLGTTYSW